MYHQQIRNAFSCSDLAMLNRRRLLGDLNWPEGFIMKYDDLRLGLSITHGKRKLSIHFNNLKTD